MCILYVKAKLNRLGIGLSCYNYHNLDYLGFIFGKLNLRYNSSVGEEVKVINIQIVCSHKPSANINICIVISFKDINIIVTFLRNCIFALFVSCNIFE